MQPKHHILKSNDESGPVALCGFTHENADRFTPSPYLGQPMCQRCVIAWNRQRIPSQPANEAEAERVNGKLVEGNEMEHIHDTQPAVPG